METTRQRRIRTERHVEGLARRSIRGAGTPSAVGRRLNRDTSTVCHDGTDRMHPTVAAFYRLLMQIPGPETTIRAAVQAVRSLLELREIVAADSPTLLARMRVLLAREDELNSRTDQAARRFAALYAHDPNSPGTHAARVAFTDLLREQSLASDELADITDEMSLRPDPMPVEVWA